MPTLPSLEHYPEQLQDMPNRSKEPASLSGFPGRGQRRLPLSVDPPVEAGYESAHRNAEDFANPEQGRHRDGTASFDLLPMAGGESEVNHILLAVAALPA